MKKVLLFGLSIAALTFVSCSDDDGDSSSTSASIEGKWYISKEGVSVNGQEVLQDYDDHEPGCEKDYVEFLANGDYKYVDFYNSDCDSYVEETTWTKSGNSINTGDGEDGTIVILTASTLKITYAETFEGQTVNYVDVFTRE
ncbi:hypothetical protein DVK85_00125 [Flavobacterium arcticum]|uniref:Lipocalin-like domain-containing protein n=1 Tax=Flavobacterium arcticum TaxID=1784713 RepID=A0A345H811_9FLAO|nr:lipocalin family protein [Flavobacterium arcticum]AXG72721.1 hypothetical protein DVK85_00125 [Flavobacterium arcticum]KAF2511008.1 hypothetical protein E0W72_06340 [Flavobacterium arcticum]